jgi:plasmid stabilization system protein ParE
VSRSLKWLPEALADLERLRAFIHVHNPDAAERAAARIREAIWKLLDNPEMGRPVINIDEPDLRDRFISFGQAGYWVRYALTDTSIIIVRIWHGRENKS